MKPISPTLSNSAVAAFRTKVYAHFTGHGRSLPWRDTTDPYCILVSEIMLQQTQVDRVIDKYTAFIVRFPDFSTLSAATTAEVVTAWQGLGYNRRALALKRCAEIVMDRWDGDLPADTLLLNELPGIGTATAAAICAYAFDMPVVYIETNIRAVYIHTFFDDADKVPDSTILPLVERTLDRTGPGRWYSALMDYGVLLKKKHKNPARRSSHHTIQSPFAGSTRRIRGLVLKLLSKDPRGSLSALIDATEETPERLTPILAALAKEGFITFDGDRVSLA